MPFTETRQTPGGRDDGRCLAADVNVAGGNVEKALEATRPAAFVKGSGGLGSGRPPSSDPRRWTCSRLRRRRKAAGAGEGAESQGGGGRPRVTMASEPRQDGGGENGQAALRDQMEGRSDLG